MIKSYIEFAGLSIMTINFTISIVFLKFLKNFWERIKINDLKYTEEKVSDLKDYT